MSKVVFNDCYGGYGLSSKACEMLRARGYDYNDFDMSYEVPRHNKDLVEIVESLGKEANTEYSKLEVMELNYNTDRYRLEVYDGWEMIITESSEGWIKLD